MGFYALSTWLLLQNPLDVFRTARVTTAYLHGLRDLGIIPDVHRDLVRRRRRIPLLQNLNANYISGHLASRGDDEAATDLLTVGRPASDKRAPAVHNDEIRLDGDVDLTDSLWVEDVVKGMELVSPVITVEYSYR